MDIGRQGLKRIAQKENKSHPGTPIWGIPWVHSNYRTTAKTLVNPLEAEDRLNGIAKLVVMILHVETIDEAKRIGMCR